MTEKPYDYGHRRSVHPVSWEDFHGICKGLVQAVAGNNPEVILAVGRGGFYPGTHIAHILRVEIHPVCLSRRVDDIVTYDRPRWITKPTANVEGKRVLIVDEICDSGETISVVKESVVARSPCSVRSAVLYAHTWSASTPDYIGLITDALLLNPWDREIWVDGVFRFHPEYVQALAEGGLEPAPSLLIDAPVIKPAKG